MDTIMGEPSDDEEWEGDTTTTSSSSSDTDDDGTADAYEAWRVVARRHAVIAAAQARAVAKPGPRNFNKEALARFYAAMEKERRAVVAAGGSPAAVWLPKTDDDAKKFIHYWEDTFAKTGSVVGRPHVGQHTRLTPAAITKAAHLIIDTSPSSQNAMNQVPAWCALLEEWGVQSDCMWRHVRKDYPRIRKAIAVEFKKALKPAVVLQRLEGAKDWLCKGLHPGHLLVTSLPHPPVGVPVVDADLTAVATGMVFMDEARMHIRPKNEAAWGVAGTPPKVVEDVRMLNKAACINYIAAVNWHTGKVLLRVVTGTKAQGKKDTSYVHPEHKVRLTCGCRTGLTGWHAHAVGGPGGGWPHEWPAPRSRARTRHHSPPAAQHDSPAPAPPPFSSDPSAAAR